MIDTSGDTVCRKVLDFGADKTAYCWYVHKVAFPAADASNAIIRIA